MSTGHVLETDRLVLRPVTMDDLDEQHAMMCDPAVMRYITGGEPRPKEKIRAAIERSMRSFDAHRFGLWRARTKAGAFVGDGLVIHIPFSGIPAERLHLDDAFGPDVEVGYRLTPACWGRGYATEIARRLVRYAMDDEDGPRLQRLVGVTHVDNDASGRVLVKAGLVAQGRSDAYYDQTLELYERRARV